MAKLLKLRRGTTTQHGSFTGAEGEVTIDTTKDTAVVHDGSTAGGRPLARQDMNNVPSGTILGTQLENSGVTAGQYGSSSAIPIVTVDAQGLVTAASTTEVDSTTIANGTSSVAVANGGNITATRSGTTRFVVDSGGTVTTGQAAVNGNIAIQNDIPVLSFVDSGDNPDFQISNQNGVLIARDTTNSADRLVINSDGHIDVKGNLDCESGCDVTGNITVTGTVDGVDIAAFKTAFDNAFPSGTKMLFQQTSAPTGWTKVTSGVNNKALRVVSGTAGSGGSNAFTTAFAARGITANAANTTQGGNVSVSVGNSTAGGNISVANNTQGGNVSVSIANASAGGTVNSHTLTTNQMPGHSHSAGNSGNGRTNPNGNGRVGNTGGAGGSQSHSHGFTGSNHSHNANASFSGNAHSQNANFSGTAHNHNANGSFTGSAHNHSISVTNLDMAVQYLDVIIATKN